MSDVKRWEFTDSGEPRVVSKDFYYRRPSPAQQSEIDQVAIDELNVLGKQIVDGWSGNPDASGTYTFKEVKLVEIKGQHTDTHKNPWTGERHWECRGVGFGHLYYTTN